MGLLLLALLVAGLGFLGYQAWERRALERDAAAVVEEARGLLQRLDGEKRVASFAAQIVGDRKPFAVIDVDGTVIGRIERDDVVDVLAGRSRPR